MMKGDEQNISIAENPSCLWDIESYDELRNCENAPFRRFVMFLSSHFRVPDVREFHIIKT